MKALRRWLIYRRLLNELTEAPQGTLAELGVARNAIGDFAWHCADAETGCIKRSLAGHLQRLHRIAILRR